MYRSNSPSVSGQVVYGPFPVQWWQVGMAPLLWFLAFALGGMADVRTQIDCTQNSCSVRVAGWRRSVREMQNEKIVSVSVDRHQGKNRWYGTPRVTFSSGVSLVLEREELPIALQEEKTIQALIDGRASKFFHDSGDKRWLALVAGGMYLVGVLLIAEALRRRRSLRLRVENGALLVDEPRRWWGVSPTLSVPLENAARVLVCWHLLRKGGSKTTPRWGATLDLEYQGGRSVALTEVPRDGLAAHYEAAYALEQLLGIPPGPPRDRCPDDVLIAYSHQGAGMVFGMIWAGLCTGSLVGMALYGVVVILIDPPSLDHNVDDRALIAAAVGAVLMAIFLARIPLGKTRELESYTSRLQHTPRQG